MAEQSGLEPVGSLFSAAQALFTTLLALDGHICHQPLTRVSRVPVCGECLDQQRQENVRGAFVVTAPEAIDGADVLLIDDVFITGATVTECAPVLRRQGARRVFVATVAGVLKAEATWAIPQDIEQPRTLAAYA